MGAARGAPGAGVVVVSAPLLPTQSRRAAASDVERLSRLSPSDPGHAALRCQVVEAHLPLVHHLARRYRHRGEPVEELVQIGTIGLIHAVDRFDPDRGVELASYATPLILGEIRQHFRDRAGAVRVPRRLIELGAEIGVAREQLTQLLGRSPTVAEVARRLQRDEESVLEALEAGRARICEPLEPEDGSDRNPYGRNGSGPDHGRYVPGSGLLEADGHDTALDLVDDRETLRPLLSRLSLRDKHVLALRLLRDASQSDIAAELGISQMQVSRILHRLVGQLSTSLVDAG